MRHGVAGAQAAGTSHFKPVSLFRSRSTTKKKGCSATPIVSAACYFEFLDKNEIDFPGSARTRFLEREVSRLRFGVSACVV